MLWLARARVNPLRPQTVCNCGPIGDNRCHATGCSDSRYPQGRPAGARQAIPKLHAYLRACILDGTLTPGTKLSQVSLARQLGVSRTPLREVLRMLQEEGLVEIEPNQRTLGGRP